MKEGCGIASRAGAFPARARAWVWCAAVLAVAGCGSDARFKADFSGGGPGQVIDIQPGDGGAAGGSGNGAAKDGSAGHGGTGGSAARDAAAESAAHDGAG